MWLAGDGGGAHAGEVTQLYGHEMLWDVLGYGKTPPQKDMGGVGDVGALRTITALHLQHTLLILLRQTSHILQSC